MAILIYFYSILKKTLGGNTMANEIREVTANELLHKVEVTERLNEVMMGCQRILDNLSRTPEQQEKSKNLQEEINILLEDMLK